MAKASARRGSAQQSRALAEVQVSRTCSRMFSARFSKSETSERDRSTSTDSPTPGSAITKRYVCAQLEVWSTVCRPLQHTPTFESPHQRSNPPRDSRGRSTWCTRYFSSTSLSVRSPEWVREIKEGPNTHKLRTKIFLFMQDPSYSVGAHIFMLLMCCLSVVAVVTYVLMESHMHSRITEGRETRALVLYGIDFSLAIIFVAEAILRLITYPSFYFFVTDINIWIDNLTLAPILVRVSFGTAPDALDGLGFWFGLLKSITTLRLLRIARHFHSGILLGRALRVSISALIVPLYMLAINCLFFGALVYACEDANYVETADEAGGDFAGSTRLSMPDAIWLMFITMTTVGYGDFSPTSDGGKLVTMVATLAGLINISLPLAIVGDNFIEVWQNRLLEYVLGKIQDDLHVRQVSDCVHAFQAFDPHATGSIDWIRFKRGAARHLQLNGALRVSELFTVWTQMDKSGAGKISLVEFCELFFPEAEVEISDMLRTLRQLQESPARALTGGAGRGGGGAAAAGAAGSGSTSNGLVRTPKSGDRLGIHESAASAAVASLPTTARHSKVAARLSHMPSFKKGMSVSNTPLQPTAEADTKAGGGASPSNVEARLASIEATLGELTGLIRRQALLGSLERQSARQDEGEPADGGEGTDQADGLAHALNGELQSLRPPPLSSQLSDRI